MNELETLGRYTLLHRVGHGGMAEIFRGFAFDADGFRQDVAIKRLHTRYLQDTQFVLMLSEEFKIIRRLRHPNIASVFELCKSDGAVYFVLEYVDGPDLRSVLKRSQRRGRWPSLADSVYLMSRALDGLDHAHRSTDEQGVPVHIVHRDFSPSNILISYSGLVKICDFGVAKATDSLVNTRSGVIKGKVKYMSPEQAYGRQLDRRSDVFSAGSVLYELCTGRPPFAARTEVDLIFEVREATPPLCSEVNPHIPPELCAILERAMNRSRSARYQTAREFAEALRGFLRSTHPTYDRAQCSSMVRGLFQEEIERDLRRLEALALTAEGAPAAPPQRSQEPH